MIHIQTAVDGHIVANNLPDSPETTITISQLCHGRAQAWLDAPPDCWQTAVVEDLSQPGEPIVFGHNPAHIIQLLPHIPSWFCLNADLAIADELAQQLAVHLDCPIRLLADLYHTLTQPAPTFPHPQVRLLTLADLPLLQGAPIALQGPQPEQTLAEMAIAGAIVAGELVAVAQNHARTATFGEIGVHTLTAWRGQGLATAVAALIAQQLQALALVPVWSCGEHNTASRRVAQKLGFRLTSQRVYLIPER